MKRTEIVRFLLLWATVGVALRSASDTGIKLIPDNTELRVGETKTFRVATARVMPQELIWKVISTANRYTGELGVVDSNGVYIAPAVLPVPNTVVVRAQDPADSTMFGTATVTLVNAVP